MEATRFLRIICLFVAIIATSSITAQEPEVVVFETIAESNYTYLDPNIIYQFVSVNSDCSSGFILQDDFGDIEYSAVKWACGIKIKNLMESEHSSFWSLMPYKVDYGNGCYVSTDPVAPSDLCAWRYTEDGKITLDFMMDGKYYFLKLTPVNVDPSDFSIDRKF